MKRIVVGIVVVWIVVVMMLIGIGAGCKDPISPLSGIEILPNVYKDHNTVYIKVDVGSLLNRDQAILNIMSKKREWELKFPAQKVVSISTVVGGGVSGGTVIGLLIHCEQR